MKLINYILAKSVRVASYTRANAAIELLTIRQKMEGKNIEFIYKTGEVDVGARENEKPEREHTPE